jgi:hypothetical protein
MRERQSSTQGEPVVEVDAKLKALGSMASQFLTSQGIATAEAFLSTQSATMVNTLMNWRKRSYSSECSVKTARNCILYGKESCVNSSVNSSQACRKCRKSLSQYLS